MGITKSGSQATKKALAQAFVELCCEMPYQKVTVRGIAQRCGVSTQTFYNNFCDKQDLLAFFIRGEIQRVFDATFARAGDWLEFSTACFENFMSHADYLRNIERNSTGIYAIEPIISTSVVEIFKAHFAKHPGPVAFDQRVEFALRNLAISSAVLMIEQLYTEAPLPQEVMRDWIIEDMSAVLRPLLLGE